ncbi:uncharacterized protein A1O9_11482 [Exophiala aquamarina CBS 119918]|uniref:Transcription factor domain-containing protein n=1 Tax=Exophiala aquamarina CBS 119918 TaxID=1182545 RepID=A0A072NXM5_9EURO|nr:uncharacterized protein A1O9_11482 [Exophiala aquamarina CBS 119918]KEF52639.1 hypothetical protein A1O9_11482 [Exophiala aquamarina CBS 119918]
MPDLETHPALLAKYLLVLATSLQGVHPELHAEAIRRLSEPPRQLIRRFAETAISLVTNNDELLGSAEGLECVLLEAMYHANGGNLRRSWFACRRGMVVAQMLGIHRSGIQQPLNVLDPTESVYPSFLWYRILCFDRQLCLMLGLPQGSLDASIASEAALGSDTPEGRFERKQNAIASRILERNESLGAGIADDVITLHELDAELQQAASELPSKWLLVPNLASPVHDPEKTFWDTLRLLDQIFYFNLLNLLHLPYILRSSTPSTGDGVAAQNFEYSKVTSAHASRELLTRFVMFRSFNPVAYCCRSVDFFALSASLTLVIAHLDGHRRQRQGVGGAGINVLAHQRSGDRAMMEQVLENMEHVAKLNTDILSERSSILLRSLLALEEDAATTPTMDQHPDLATRHEQGLRMDIPYFGTITIGREGIISMEVPPRPTSLPSVEHHKKQEQHEPDKNGAPAPEVITSARDGYSVDQELSGAFDADMLSEPEPPSFHGVGSHIAPPEFQQTPHDAGFAPTTPSAINTTLQQSYLYPGLTASVDNWAFQGVDMAFFDSLLRGSGTVPFNETDNGNYWADWDGAS